MQRQFREFFLHQDDKPFFVQVVLNFLISLTGSALLVAITYAISKTTGAAWFTSGTSSVEQLDPLTVFGVIAFAPILETLLLIVGLKLFEFLGFGFFQAAFGSAIAWGILHGLLAPIRFFGSITSFFVFGCAYLAWRRKSFNKAFWSAAIPHALVNTTVVLIAAVGSNV